MGVFGLIYYLRKNGYVTRSGMDPEKTKIWNVAVDVFNLLGYCLPKEGNRNGRVGSPEDIAIHAFMRYLDFFWKRGVETHLVFDGKILSQPKILQKMIKAFRNLAAAEKIQQWAEYFQHRNTVSLKSGTPLRPEDLADISFRDICCWHWKTHLPNKRIAQQHLDFIKNIFSLFGIPVYFAPGEADTYCVQMADVDWVDATFSGDGDFIAIRGRKHRKHIISIDLSRDTAQLVEINKMYRKFRREKITRKMIDAAYLVATSEYNYLFWHECINFPTALLEVKELGSAEAVYGKYCPSLRSKPDELAKMVDEIRQCYRVPPDIPNFAQDAKLSIPTEDDYQLALGSLLSIAGNVGFEQNEIESMIQHRRKLTHNTIVYIEWGKLWTPETIPTQTSIFRRIHGRGPGCPRRQVKVIPKKKVSKTWADDYESPVLTSVSEPDALPAQAIEGGSMCSENNPFFLLQ